MAPLDLINTLAANKDTQGTITQYGLTFAHVRLSQLSSTMLRDMEHASKG